MKKLNFLQRYLIKRQGKKNKKILNSNEYKIGSLEHDMEQMREYVHNLNASISDLSRQSNLKRLTEEKEERKKTDPYRADKWKVIYNADKKLSEVYLNGVQLYGARSFAIDFDGTQNNKYKDVPIISYEGYGSVDILTESE